MVTLPIATPSNTSKLPQSSDFSQSRGTSVVLENISWQQYEQLLDVLGDRPASRIAYEDGLLEIMTPLPDHEYFSDSIADAVKDIADELDMNYD